MNWGATQIAELASSANANYTKVDNLNGGTYEVRFDYACRDDAPSLASMAIDIYWNFVFLLNINCPAVNDFAIHTQSFILEAVTGNNYFSLVEVGVEEGLGFGMTIDNVEIYETYDGNWV